MGNYRFPACVTAVHFLAVWVVCVLYWLRLGEPSKLFPYSLGSKSRYLTYVSPIACSLPLSVAFNNKAMVFVGAGLNSIVGTVTPVTTALLSHFMGSRLAKPAWIGVSIACIGAVIIAFGELRQPAWDGSLSASLVTGLTFSVSAVLLRSLKVVLQDKLLNTASYHRNSAQIQDTPLSPMHVWALQAPPCTLISFCYAMMTESFLDALGELSLPTVAMILCTCASASCLNILGMIVIKELGASSMQIVGKLNTIIVVALSVGFLGERLPSEVVAGTCVVLLGVATFEHAQRHGKNGILGMASKCLPLPT